MAVATKQDIIRMVEHYLGRHEPTGNRFSVLSDQVRRTEYGWWWVPVRPAKNIPKSYEYYEILANVEEDLAEEGRVDALLVPTYPDESETATSKA